MKKPIEEIAYDVKYIREHTLQPRWFKVSKVFILIGLIAIYANFFGAVKATLFVVVFLLLSVIVHFTYRIKTERYTKSWLDFRVREENGRLVTERIGKFYYSAIIMNLIIAFATSQFLGK